MSELLPRLIIDPELKPHIAHVVFEAENYAEGLDAVGVPDDVITRTSLLLRYGSGYSSYDQWPFGSYDKQTHQITLWPQVIARVVASNRHSLIDEDMPQPQSQCQSDLSLASNYVLLQETALLADTERRDPTEQLAIKIKDLHLLEKLRSKLLLSALVGSFIGTYVADAHTNVLPVAGGVIGAGVLGVAGGSYQLLKDKDAYEEVEQYRRNRRESFHEIYRELSQTTAMNDVFHIELK